METRVDKIEVELTSMKEGIEIIRSEMRENNTRMERMKSNIETIKEFLIEFRESTITCENNNAGKTPMGANPSLLYTSSPIEPTRSPPKIIEEVIIMEKGTNKLERQESEKWEVTKRVYSIDG